MLPPAALDAADRLITTLMTLVRALAPGAHTPTLPEDAKQTLLLRLIDLVTRLIRISNFGVRPPAKSNAAPEPLDAESSSPRRPTRRATTTLPRRPGWLLAALPEIAPSIAADLQSLLADPATATLLHAVPTLHRTLRPLLRGLGLQAAPTPPAPSPPPPSAPAPSLAAPPPRPANPPRPAKTAHSPSWSPRVVTLTSFRVSNK